MSKSMLNEKANRLADASANAAIQAAIAARMGWSGDAETLDARACRLDAMAANYREAARRAH